MKKEIIEVLLSVEKAKLNWLKSIVNQTREYYLAMMLCEKSVEDLERQLASL